MSSALDDSNAAGGAKPAGGKQALLRRAWRSAAWIVSAPLRVFPREEIAKSASAIATVVGVLKRGPRPGPTVTVIDDRTFDLEATAFRQGLSVSQLEALLRRRRRASARFAYLAFGMGWLCFGAWLYRLTHGEWSAGFLVTAVEFVPFCLVFFLLAFKSGLENYQLRTRRRASVMEYLRTSESFWPS
jgi:hypothetical protein